MSDPQAWAIQTKCRWCAAPFVQLEIDHARAWVCETEACRERQIAWKRVDLAGKLFYLPLPIQVELHEAIQSQQYGAICMGGHRGSSKSIAVRNAIYNAGFAFPELAVLLFRRQLVDLELNQWRFFEREAPRLGLDWTPKKLTFPTTGAEVRAAHSKDPEDFKKYIGGDVDFIVMEQLEEFLQKQAVEIGASTGRNTRYDTWRGLWLTTENPGGPLSDFVNQIFVRKDLAAAKYPQYNPADYHFIEARLEDNPWTDARYEQKLAILSPARRAMMRHGRRDIFEGQFFPDWSRDQHVVARDTRGAKWMLSLHWGFNQEGAVLLWAILPDRHLHIRAQLALEQVNEDTAADAIRVLCAQAPIASAPFTVANPEIFLKPNDDALVGQSIAETLSYYRVPVAAGDADELNGWKRIHALLRPSPDGSPWLTVHPSCEGLIAALQNALSDKDDADLMHPESVGLSMLHALRLGAMARPAPEFARTSVVYPPGTPGYVLQQHLRGSRGRKWGQVA